MAGKRKNVSFSSDIDDQLAAQEEFYASGVAASAHARRSGQKTTYNFKSNNNFGDTDKKNGQNQENIEDNDAIWISGPSDEGNEQNDSKLFTAPEYTEEQVSDMIKESGIEAVEVQQNGQEQEQEPPKKSQRQVCDVE
jgi:hypothetical protein